MEYLHWILCYLFQEEWINQSIYDLIHPEDKDKLRDQLGTEINHDSRILDPKSENCTTFAAVFVAFRNV